MSKLFLTWGDVQSQLPGGPWHKRIWGVPRGGIYIALMLERFNGCTMCMEPDHAQVIVDDLIDSGETRRDYEARFPNRWFYAPYDKSDAGLAGKWIVFPWEAHDQEDDTPERHLMRYFQALEDQQEAPSAFTSGVATIRHARHRVQLHIFDQINVNVRDPRDSKNVKACSFYQGSQVDKALSEMEDGKLDLMRQLNLREMLLESLAEILGMSVAEAYGHGKAIERIRELIEKEGLQNERDS